MPADAALGADNLLLSRLPARDHGRVLARCETVALPFAEVLLPASARVRHVNFPQDSVISLGRVQADGSSLEVALVGRDGMFGLPVVLRAPILRAAMSDAPTRKRALHHAEHAPVPHRRTPQRPACRPAA